METDEELQEKLDQAVRDKDGWLAHFYGSQLAHRYQVREEIGRKREERMRKYRQIMEDAEFKAELMYQHAMESEKHIKSIFRCRFSR